MDACFVTKMTSFPSLPPPLMDPLYSSTVFFLQIRMRFKSTGDKMQHTHFESPVHKLRI